MAISVDKTIEYSVKSKVFTLLSMTRPRITNRLPYSWILKPNLVNWLAFLQSYMQCTGTIMQIPSLHIVLIYIFSMHYAIKEIGEAFAFSCQLALAS